MKVKYLLAVIFSLALSAQAQKSLLELNLEKGKVYKQVIASQTDMTMNMFGQKMPMGMTMNFTISYLVQSINDTAYEMEVKYEQMSMNMLVQGVGVDYNSGIGEDDIVSSILNKMLNKPFEMTMNKQGEVVDVRNIDTIINGLLESMSENPEYTKEELEQTRQQIKETYGEDALKGNMGMSTVVFPKYPIKKGEKWTVQTNLPSAGINATVVTEYKWIKKTQDYNLIKGTSKIRMTDDKNNQLISGIPIGFNVSGTMASEIKTNPSTGWVVDSKIEMAMTMDASAQKSKQKQDALGLQIKMLTKMKVTD